MSFPAAIEFTHRGITRQLAWGEHFSSPRELGFRDAPADDLRELIRAVESGRPWREVIGARFAATKPWLHRIVTDPCRTAFVDHVLPPGPGAVLDIGAGWGQLCRPLAALRPVVALEPVAERLDFIAAAARQDGIEDRLAYVAADYLELAFTTRFSAITCIGVLEWAGAFQEHADPQARQREFLAKTRRELADGGHLVIGIENRLGLKYLLGVPDDHLGVPHVACLPAALARRRWQETTGQEMRSFTYSHAELATLLREAGFHQVEFFAAFPDYKLPAAILPFGLDGAAVNEWLLREPPPPEHNGYDGTSLAPEMGEALLAQYRSLAQQGIAHIFAPSFFVRAA